MYLSPRVQTFLVVWQGGWIKSIGQIYQGFWEKNLSPVDFSKIRPLLMLFFSFINLTNSTEFYTVQNCVVQLDFNLGITVLNTYLILKFITIIYRQHIYQIAVLI